MGYPMPHETVDFLARDKDGKLNGRMSWQWRLYFTQRQELSSSNDGLKFSESSSAGLAGEAEALAQMAALSQSSVKVIDDSGLMFESHSGRVVDILEALAFVPSQRPPLNPPLYDTAANIANYPASAYPDTVYVTSDATIKIIYLSDGSTWNQVGPFDDAYGAGWNGVTKGVTQNAVYDKIESLGLASGVYTPTLFNTTNMGASTAYQCQYLRVGSVVTVSGRVDVDPTAPAAATVLGISLPIASNIGATEDIGGTAFAPNIAGQGAAIYGDAANDRASMQWVAGDITNQAMLFSFTYRVI